MRNQPFKAEAVVFPTLSCSSPTYILINGDYYHCDHITHPDNALKDIRQRFLTKSFEHLGDTTKITLSDGREFFHPHPSTHETMVFSSSDKKFIPIDVFDEMIESIPLDGVYDD